jgi:hypothetical protein
VERSWRLGSGRGFTDHIKQATSKYHGTAARAFIQAPIKNLPDALGKADEIEQRFLKRLFRQSAADS